MVIQRFSRNGFNWKYALGELFLIVLGILIALKVNNWNEKRIEKKIVLTYLERIQVDLTQDIEQLNILIQSHQDYYDNISGYFDYFSESKKSVVEVIDSAKNVKWTHLRYIPYNQTYRDLTSTGNIGLLSQEIRNLLTNLKKDQDHVIIILNKFIDMINSYAYKTNENWGIPNHFYETFDLPSQELLIAGLNFNHMTFDLVQKLAEVAIFRYGQLVKKSQVILNKLAEY